MQELGEIDILVNNAGIAVIAPIDDYRLEDLDRTMAVNVRAVFIATQATVKHMQAGGRIINVGNCNAERVPFTGGGVCAMSKAALVALPRYGSGDEIASLVAYLASSEATYVAGASLTIDGGLNTRETAQQRRSQLEG